MPIPLLAAALAAGAIRTGWGLISGHKNADRQRNLLYDAYGRTKQRLGVQQQDVRQGTAESLGARGLASGGGVRVGGAVEPTPVDYDKGTMKHFVAAQAASGGSLALARRRAGLADAPTTDKGSLLRAAMRSTAGQPHTLGEQAGADLAHEQLLEQNDLLARRDVAIDDVGHAATQGAVDSIGAGINTAASVYSLGKELGAGGAAAAGATDIGNAIGAGRSAAGAALPGVAGVGTIRGAFGIDPITGKPQIPITPTPALNPALGEGQANYNFRRKT